MTGKTGTMGRWERKGKRRMRENKKQEKGVTRSRSH